MKTISRKQALIISNEILLTAERERIIMDDLLIERRVMSEWKQYKRKGLSEMRFYVLGEDLTGVSVSDTDDPPNDMGMIARNPKNHADQWYVARKYFEDNLEVAYIAWTRW